MPRCLLVAFALAVVGCSREVQVIRPVVGGGVDGGTDAGVPNSGASALAAGTSHTCRIDRGALFCWGVNDRAQLGREGGDSDVPLRVGDSADWTAIGLGDEHSCGLRGGGALYCWGANDRGQLGLGDLDDRVMPTLVSVGPWQQLAAGEFHTCAIDSMRRLSCWGRNDEGQIGLGDPYGDPDALAPRFIDSDQRYVDVAGGEAHTCAIRTDGRIYCWGRNTQAQIGLGGVVPQQVRSPNEVDVTGEFLQVEASQHHGCAIRNDGALFCWGLDLFGEVGQGFGRETNTRVPRPTRVGDRTDWTALDLHWFHTCAIARDRGLYCFGRNDEGQLGDGMGALNVGLPQAVPGPKAWLRIAVGRFHTCAQEASGATNCWGANNRGQLAVGDFERRSTPTPIVAP